MTALRASLRAAGVLMAAMLVAFTSTSRVAAQDPEDGLTTGTLLGDPSPAAPEVVRPQLRPAASAAPAVIGGTSLALGGMALVASWSVYIARTNYRQRAFPRLTDDVIEPFETMGAWSFGLGISAAALLVTSEYLLLPKYVEIPTLAWIAGGAGVALAAVGIGFAVGGTHCGPEAYEPGSSHRLACSAGTSDALFGSLLLLSSAPLISIPVVFLLRKAFAGAPESLSLTPGGVQLSGRF